MTTTRGTGSGALLAVLLLTGSCSPERWGGDGGLGDGGSDSGGGCDSVEPRCSSSGREVVACDPATGRDRVVSVCGEGEACVDAACRVSVCVPGAPGGCPSETVERYCLADGSGWAERPCGAEQRCIEDAGGCATPCVLRVFILLDRSGSMGSEAGSSTKWEQARVALATLMAEAVPGEVEFGLGVFPSGGDSCGTGAQVVYPVPEANASNVDAYFSANAPTGATPLHDALTRHLEEIGENLSDRAYASFILVVSDGADTCYDARCLEECGIFSPWCIINCEERAEQEVIVLLGETTARLRDERAIRTFVIGFGSGVSRDELDAIAGNGGTVLGRWLQASDVSDLSAAFRTVLDEMLECNPIVY